MGISFCSTSFLLLSSKCMAAVHKMGQWESTNLIFTRHDTIPLYNPPTTPAWYSSFKTWWHMRRNQIWSFSERMSPFKLAGVSVQSATGSRGVCISGSNGDRLCSDTVQDCWLPTPFASFPFTSSPVRHRVPSDSERAIQTYMLTHSTWQWQAFMSSIQEIVFRQ